MTVKNRRAGLIAFAMQSAVGVPVDPEDLDPGQALWVLPKSSGGIKATRDRADLPLTRPNAARPGQMIQRARGAGTVTVLGHPEPLGMLLYMAMGSVVDTGTTHVFTVNEDLPATPLTVWDQVADHWEVFTDTYIQVLTIRGASGDPVYIVLDMVSWGNQDIVEPTQGGGDPFSDLILDPDPRFKYMGSTVYLEADSPTPVEVTNVDNVELVIGRTLDLRYGPSLTPVLGIPARDIDFTAGLTYDSEQQGWDFYRVAKRGLTSPLPLDVSQDLGQGSFKVVFGKHPDDYTGSLTIESNGDNWQYDVERPDSDPGGGAVEMDVAGMVIDPGMAASEITVTLVNLQNTVS